MKKFRYVIIIFFLLLMNLIPSNCIYKRVKGTNEDTQKRFLVGKNYIYSVFFEGIIIKKEFHEQKQNFYSVDILLRDINPIANLSQKATLFSYYRFINDSLLNLRIDKNIYEKIKVNDIIFKDNNDYNIQINGEIVPFLNKNENKWFHNDK